MNFINHSVLKSDGENPNESTPAAIDEIAETKEKVDWNYKKARCWSIHLDDIKVTSNYLYQ